MSSSSRLSPIPLANQVGGHPGVSTTEDGSLLFKNALSREVAFYQSIALEPALAPLQDLVPQFYGTLKLEGKIDTETPGIDSSTIRPLENVPESEKEFIVLENLAHSFMKPNILDIKLGTVLYDDDAPPEKRARMEKVARETTSQETGMRLTGFQVYDLATDNPIVTSKTYGKSIKPADLPEGFARFFPLASNPPAPGSISKSSPGASSSKATPSTGTGLPAELLIPVLSGIHAEVKDIHDAMASIEVRMVGGSLLIVYEADWECAREGLRLLHEERESDSSSADDDEDDEEEEDEGDDEDDMKSVGPPFVVKLIDFAHTRILPGEGPDNGALLGLRTVLGLLDNRLEQVKAIAKVM